MVNSKGFTLIECLVVVAILGILSSLAMPSFKIAWGVLHKLEDATIAAAEATAEFKALGGGVGLCLVGTECEGKPLVCYKSSKVKPCTEASPCEFLAGSWEQSSQPCEEGILYVKGAS